MYYITASCITRQMLTALRGEPENACITHEKGRGHVIPDMQVYSNLQLLITWEAYDQYGEIWRIYI